MKACVHNWPGPVTPVADVRSTGGVLQKEIQHKLGADQGGEQSSAFLLVR